MIRVANIIEEARVGGPQVRMVRVAAALEGQVETVIFMPEDSSAPFVALCEREGVAYRRFPITRITKSLGPALRYLLFTPFEVARLTLALRRMDIDLVHVSGGSWQFKGVLAARLAGKPAVWHLNDTKMPKFIKAAFRVMSPMAIGFIFASERSRDYYRDLCPPRRPEAVVPSVVDRKRFDPSQTFTPDADDRALLESWGQDPVVGTIANVNPVKGLDTLIRAAAVLERRVSKVHVAIIGQISERQQQHLDKLNSLIDELQVRSLTFCGPRTDVRPLLHRFDVYLCSSIAESSPVSVWEAMAMEKAVISTDVGDVARHVRQGKEGYVVPVGDHAAMATHVENLLANPSLRRTMGKQARRAATAFSPETIANQTLAIYRSTMQSYLKSKAEPSKAKKSKKP